MKCLKLLSRYKLINSPLKGVVQFNEILWCQDSNKKFVEHLKSKNIKIMVWTINDV